VALSLLAYKFTGKERDGESGLDSFGGLDFFGARYYASSLGRWMVPCPNAYDAH
jgi:RHS repeat-associated protein